MLFVAIAVVVVVFAFLLSVTAVSALRRLSAAEDAAAVAGVDADALPAEQQAARLVANAQALADGAPEQVSFDVRARGYDQQQVDAVIDGLLAQLRQARQAQGPHAPVTPAPSAQG
ncbi:hypothetical protein C1Y63_01645 [Corynebacterium sp. 13CS0277]|uniref:hypothetical protein n=1 Tax=Corynebacterium sp. 13CS0277 TaxID=2071994 RepID=UPI000D02DDAB|nr:hypothetical protein [Corynebacterium sp. 13CS0277]PRQ12286.1 hypothetical protein C1Y63_01645 [Corynebacterium sp. 13CS0277]